MSEHKNGWCTHARVRFQDRLEWNRWHPVNQPQNYTRIELKRVEKGGVWVYTEPSYPHSTIERRDNTLLVYLSNTKPHFGFPYSRHQDVLRPRARSQYSVEIGRIHV